MEIIISKLHIYFPRVGGDDYKSVQAQELLSLLSAIMCRCILKGPSSIVKGMSGDLMLHYLL